MMKTNSLYKMPWVRTWMSETDSIPNHLGCTHESREVDQMRDTDAPCVDAGDQSDKQTSCLPR